MEMIRLSGQQGVPVITVGDQVVVGFNRPRLESLLAARRPTEAKRKSLGASVADAATLALRRPGLPASGAYVGGVHPGSPAESAGLRAGDVIVAVDNKPVPDAAGLQVALAASPAGRPVTLAYQRDGAVQQVQVAL